MKMLKRLNRKVFTVGLLVMLLLSLALGAIAHAGRVDEWITKLRVISSFTVDSTGTVTLPSAVTFGTYKHNFGTVSNAIANTTITSTGYGKTYTNEGATKMIIYTLPAATGTGGELTFAVVSAYIINVNPAGTERILSITNANGDQIWNGTAGASVTVTDVDTGKWVLKSNYLTWNDGN